ncbi:hypothetical protein DE146DRAFT_602026 [Phaeosphaeria sp. MPI-PUGE-AT-0046c]|nr:hypothetical protein DE146DRAFT_602026 [Phaeosphaeria sp. MPI-PUGE-AT-0046c]
MVDVWSGDILLPDGDPIKDVGLTSPNIASSQVLPPTALRFLSTVETAKIPLYLSAGPSLDVWTTSEATEAWFESILLSKPVPPTTTNDDEHAWWNLARSQSPIGILVQLQHEAEDLLRPRITEILFYGTIAPPTIATLPTPPSASPEHHVALTNQLPELKVHAIPLSSDLLYAPASIDVLQPIPAPNTTDVEAQFLPQRDTLLTPDSPKRKRDLFEEATIANKKTRGKGGAGISAAAARASESQSALNQRRSLSIDTKTLPLSDSRPPSANGPLPRPASRQLSRSPSISSDIRPLSRKGTSDAHNKRSTLSQVDTVSLQPEEPTTEMRNKEALSRVVMAAMRMHGLQQRNKGRSRWPSAVHGNEDTQELEIVTAAEEATKDAEYKLMFHQIHKGVAFAFRNHITEKPLHAQPDQFRDVVEKFLTIYISDPLAQTLPADRTSNPVATPGTKSHLTVNASPFDLPSSARPGIMRSKTDSHIHTGSPISRRNVGEHDVMPG